MVASVAPISIHGIALSNDKEHDVSSKYPNYHLRNYRAAGLSIIFVMALVMLANPARATDQPDYDDPAFGAAVRDRLLANPEVLLEIGRSWMRSRPHRRQRGIAIS